MSVFRQLTAHFFRRFFEGELEDQNDENGLGASGSLALLASPGLFLSLLLMNKYSPVLGPNALLLSLPDQYVFVNYAMTVTGIVVILKWDSLFPDRRDFANLAMLPIGLSKILYAKAAALALLLGVFALSVNGASVIVYPVVVSNVRGVNLPSFFAGHFVCVLFATVFAFFATLALIGVLMSALPPRWFAKISRIVRGAGILILLAAFLTTMPVADALAHLKPGSPLRFLPQFWFIGLSQAVMGRHAVPALTALAPAAIGSCVFAPLLAAAAYYASYKRTFVRIPETLDVPSGSPGRSDSLLLRLLDRALVKRPFDRACLRFAIKTIFRSERHGLSLGAWMGLAITLAGQAMVEGAVNGRGRELNADLLSVPLILCFFLLCSLRSLFDRPAELRANWIFQMAARPGAGAGERLAAEVMLLFAAPFVVGTGIVVAIFYGLGTGCMHAAFLTAVILVLTTFLRAGFRKIPFTCSLQAWKHNPASGLGLALGGFLVFVSIASRAEYWMMGRPQRVVVVAAVLGAVAFAWQWFARRLAYDAESPVIFEDEREPAVRTMDLYSPHARLNW